LLTVLEAQASHLRNMVLDQDLLLRAVWRFKSAAADPMTALRPEATGHGKSRPSKRIIILEEAWDARLGEPTVLLARTSIQSCGSGPDHE
jgi:hypothetical protein